MSIRDREALNKRAEEILSRLKDGEKCRLLYGDGLWNTHALLKKGIVSVTMHDGPLGLRVPIEKVDDFHPDSEPATCFPAPCLLACSWDVALEKEIGRAMAMEAITYDTDLLLAPGVNLKRNPLCGRNFEYFSEDPYLSGKMGAAFIQGVQSQGVGCCLKHYALNNQEYHRFTVDVELDERTLREFYLLPFEIAVKEAEPWAVMASYNRINGTYACDNSYLLEDVLMKEWSFDGPVISDWGATSHPVRSHDFGLCLEMPGLEKREKTLKKALRKRELRKEKLNEAAKRVIKLSLLSSGRAKNTEGWMFADNHRLAKKAAIESMILLKNDDGFLPFRNYSECCIIGALADKFRYQGEGSSRVTPQALVNFLSAIPEGEEVPYAPGYPLKGDECSAQEYFQEALDLVSRKKRVILFLGLPDGVESEGFDRKKMTLPQDQLSLFEAIRALTEEIVVVLLTGSPIELGSIKKAKSILLAYLPGEAGGEAIDELLRGVHSPSGKLAESWPLSYSQVPSSSYFDKEERVAPYKEAFFIGYRYYDSFKEEIAYPFGFGLSYTSFHFENVVLDKKEKKISFTIENIGNFPAFETPQVYVSYLGKDAIKPKKELAGFTKVFLEPKQKKTVTISLSPYPFRIWDTNDHLFKELAGKYEIYLALSSQNFVAKPMSYVIKKGESSYKASEEFLMQVPTYLSFKDTGNLCIDEREFSALLGRPLTPDAKKTNRPFNLNSTLEEVGSFTKSGKFILSLLRKKYIGREKEYDLMLSTPIRMLTHVLKPSVIAFLLDCANGRHMRAFFELIFGVNSSYFAF